MSHQTVKIALILGLLSSLPPAVAEGHFNLPPLPPPHAYGNILINRVSEKGGMKPVAFSHWQHRKKYTCRVCHTELEFNMKVNSTEITEAANKAGKYCGACHNGKIAFKHRGNCDKCHNGDIDFGQEKFADFPKQPFPTIPYGNGINWVEALRRGMITPVRFLQEKPKDIFFDKTLLLESEWSMIPAAIFPHKAHSEWVDCNTCHPEIFNIQKKTTQHFSMPAILKGQFCGVCHLNVAFPMDDCNRCHPGIKNEKPSPQ